MPASPADGAALAAAILDAIHRLEQQLISMIAGRLRSGINTPGWADNRMAEVLLLEQRITRQVQAATPGILDEIRAITRDAYIHGQALAVADLQDAGIAWDIPSGALTLADRAAEQAAATLHGALDWTPDLVMDVYRQAVQRGAAQVLGGSLTRLQASQQVLNELAARGVTGFRDRAGRDWALESYAEMAVRTAAGHAAIDGHVDALAASGLDLVIVSDAPRECPLCRPWERQVLSISGRVGAVIEPSRVTDRSVVVQVTASLAQARAAGLFHPNCRHTLSAYLPGVTVKGVARPDAKRYEAGQRQREIERMIRAWKRRQAAALDAAAEQRARAKVNQWRAVQRAHVHEHGLTRLPRRERIGTAI